MAVSGEVKPVVSAINNLKNSGQFEVVSEMRTKVVCSSLEGFCHPTTCFLRRSSWTLFGLAPC